MLLGAVEKFPSHAQLHFYLGSMYDRVGRTEDSINEMKRVLEIDQENVQAMNYLAYTYAELNRDLAHGKDGCHAPSLRLRRRPRSQISRTPSNPCGRAIMIRISIRA